MTDFPNEMKHLPISAFSELSGISRKNLIYYDNIGLLKPALKKKNGYRYYSYGQIEDVSIIHALKGLDVPLEEIKKYMKDISPENLIQLIGRQKQKILEELNRLNQMNYIIEQRLSNYPTLSRINCNEIILEASDEELLFLGPKLSFDTNNVEKEFDDFLFYCHDRNLVYGYPLGLCADFHELLSGRTFDYHFFLKVNPNIEVEKTKKPAGLYVIAYDNSYLADSDEIFEKLDKFIRESGFRSCGNIYIENISDEITSKTPGKYYSRISILVENSELSLSGAAGFQRSSFPGGGTAVDM